MNSWPVEQLSLLGKAFKEDAWNLWLMNRGCVGRYKLVKQEGSPLDLSHTVTVTVRISKMKFLLEIMPFASFILGGSLVRHELEWNHFTGEIGSEEEREERKCRVEVIIMVTFYKDGFVFKDTRKCTKCEVCDCDDQLVAWYVRI